MIKILPVFLFFFITTTVRAQLVEKTVASNVGEPLTGIGYNINFTVGEPIVGPISNAISIGQGFWAGELTVEPLAPEETLDGIFIYPNPVENLLTIFTNNMEIIGIHLFAVNGQLVLRQKMDAQQLEQQIDLSHITKGAYVLRLYVKGDNKGKLFKIIKK